MAGSLNRAQIIGHLGADPEIRTLNSGGKVANFRIATSESWTDKNSGEKKEATEWHSVVVWNENLIKGVIEKWVKKGSRVMVEGQLKTRKWQDKDGNDRYSTEIVLQGFNGIILLLDSKKDGDGGATRQVSEGEGKRSNFSQELEDEVPFAPEWR